MTAAHLAADSATMLRRSLRRMRRYPSLTLFIAGIPVVLMLLFVYVFGGALGAGIGAPGLVAPGLVAPAGAAAGDGGTAGREAYLAYVVPAILLIAVVGAAQGTAISVAMDMTQGIVARFRTMAIARTSVLGGHLMGAVVQTALATALVVAVALLIGFRPATGPLAWLGAAGLLALVTVAVTVLAVGLGLAADSVETASNSPMILMLLPFLGSGFVPTASMPGPLRWFAEVQPFTPIGEALRSLLLGTPSGNALPIALAWCLAISLAGWLWSARLYERLPVRPGV
jgi:ABC-2 type transport system permease protein